MPYNKKDLLKAKEKLGSDRLHRLRKKTNSISKKVIKNENFNKKTIIHKYNFEINELVYIKHTNQIGLIISNDTYFNRRVQKDCYFVFIENRVTTLDGSSLKKV
tara:strand:- start:1141 stop:1452 length:312 start_codon:yes stop_codon:yes gene_type:complete